MTTVDRLAEQQTPRAIKADVEGYEAEVLAGAAATLDDADLQVVILELNGSGRMFGIEDADVHTVITSHGFRPHRYDPTTRTLPRRWTRGTATASTPSTSASCNTCSGDAKPIRIACTARRPPGCKG